MRMKRLDEKTSFAPTRRQWLQSARGALTLLVAGNILAPAGLHAQSNTPEVKGAKLGFIALTDSAPLIIAKVKGLFEKYGMPDVEVLKQASWGALRDNLALGGAQNGIDGAHILRPMPYLMSIGKVTQNNVPVPIQIVAALNLDCQGISVSNEYKDAAAALDSSKLKAAFEGKKASGKPVKAAMTFPGGTHDMWIRYWLAAGGIDPDKDVETIVVPPPQMVANMKVGSMDVFCVGEPWNEQLVNQDIGYTACTTGEIWKKHPEKVLGLRKDFIDANPNATKALIAAVIEAQQWCEKPENKEEMAAIVSTRAWFNVPVKDIIGRIKGDINYGLGRVAIGTDLGMKFFKDGASFPYESHDLWFLTEHMRWGKLEATTDVKALVASVNRADLWRDAAKLAGVDAADIPASNSRGIETFFDGKTFDPTDPMAYLKSLSIKREA
jgi:nitrate/nitrite transport system substrate-binding protein